MKYIFNETSEGNIDNGWTGETTETEINAKVFAEIRSRRAAESQHLLGDGTYSSLYAAALNDDGNWDEIIWECNCDDLKFAKEETIIQTAVTNGYDTALDRGETDWKTVSYWATESLDDALEIFRESGGDESRLNMDYINERLKSV